MKVVARPPEVAGGELLVLLEPAAGHGRGVAWAVSLVLHAAALVALSFLPAGSFTPPPRPELRASTTLVAPPRQLTQRAPNTARPAKEVTLEGLLPRPPVRVPAAVPPVTSSAAARPPAPAPRMVPEAPKLEDPKPQLSQAPPAGSLQGLPAPPPPEIQPEEKPKIAFERPGRPEGLPQIPGLGRVAPPSESVTEAARASMRSGAGGTLVGDFDLPGSSGISGGLNLPGTRPSRNSSSLELLSDPQGIDFKPYLIQVLAAVKRNWMAVIPESARMGRQGRVQIQFAIARDGSVPKLVIAVPSGTYAFDHAAVAGISMSTPFPPLPGAFTGNQVRLQFTFTYNITNPGIR
jgi:TonB family protein